MRFATNIIAIIIKFIAIIRFAVAVIAISFDGINSVIKIKFMFVN
jgi:hypothetical protein